nr:MAG: ORF1 [TTV-like mini virus]
MPAYWRRWYPYYQRRRRRRFRAWRARRTVQRRRTRRYRVRLNRKPLKLLQWQPPFIKKCYIKGKMCLLMFSPYRLPFNSTMYELSTVPEHWPNGGGFSVTQLSLNCLFDMHNRCRNWWTGSNLDLPLCRYSGTYIKLYQCQNTDYIVKIQTQLPSNSNKLTYPSTQPSMMMMAEGKIIVPSIKNKKKRKPYIKVFVPPPPQLQNKWYFQTDMYKTSLMTIHCSACSLQNYFLKPNTLSDNITFTSLNTFLIQNRQMGIDDKQPWWNKYLGTLKSYLYYYDGNSDITNPQKLLVKDFIPLTQTLINRPGKSYNQHSFNHNETMPDFSSYKNNYSNYWGNPFYHEHLKNPELYFYSTVSPDAIKADEKFQENAKWEQLSQNNRTITQLSEPLFWKLQYNPNKDTGQDTQVYLMSNKSGDGWDPPTKSELILDGFPMWLILWGYSDFQTKLKIVTNIETNYMITIKSNFTQKPMATPIVPIDEQFLEGKSPYHDECLPADLIKWYPQQQFQTRVINKIVSCGPGTPYLEGELCENINIFYSSVWRWGGSPPKHIDIENPAHQIVYPIPSNIDAPPSLQSPTQAPENILYSFDHRHGIFTKSAIERITKDWSTPTIVTSITDKDLRQQLRETFQELKTTEEKEHQTEEEILLQLHNLKHQQQCLRQRIMCLLDTKLP